jgi:hypothetical protein
LRRSRKIILGAVGSTIGRGFIGREQREAGGETDETRAPAAAIAAGRSGYRSAITPLE